MSLSRNDIVKLLALVSVLDDRDTDDRLLIDAWHAMAEQGKWESFEVARRALLVYRSEQPDYPVRPGHITQVLERVRSVVSRTFEYPLLPKQARGDWQTERDLLDQARVDHRQQVMASWASGDSDIKQLERSARPRVETWW